MNNIKLHLGCDKRKIHGYVNIDIRGDVNPDIIDDICVLKKFKKNSINEIYACHVLEHINKANFKKVLNRWYEVLKPNGILKVCVPDLQAICEHYIFHKNLDILIGLLYGGQRHPYDFHYIGWDEKTLTKDLSSIHFKNIKRYDWRETDHFYIDDYSQCYLPKISYNTRQIGEQLDGKLMSLNMKATK